MVCVVYVEHGDVVSVDACCCCEHACCGDLFMPRNCMNRCGCSLAENDGDVDVVLVVYSVVLALVMVVICCCYDSSLLGGNLGPLECIVMWWREVCREEWRSKGA